MTDEVIVWKVEVETEETGGRKIHFEGQISTRPDGYIVSITDNLAKLGCREGHALTYWTRRLNDRGFTITEIKQDKNSQPPLTDIDWLTKANNLIEIVRNHVSNGRSETAIRFIDEYRREYFNINI